MVALESWAASACVPGGLWSHGPAHLQAFNTFIDDVFALSVTMPCPPPTGWPVSGTMWCFSCTCTSGGECGPSPTPGEALGRWAPGPAPGVGALLSV